MITRLLDACGMAKNHLGRGLSLALLMEAMAAKVEARLISVPASASLLRTVAPKTSAPVTFVPKTAALRSIVP